MTTAESVILEVPDTAAAQSFYDAFGIGDRVSVRASETPTTGFRSHTLSLVVSQPNIVDAFVDAALEAGATVLKPVKKSFWGYGGVVQAPDGAIWKVATSSKKNTGPATREIEDLVLLLGVEDVKASKQFYVDHGLEVSKSYGRKYVQFTAPRKSSRLPCTAGRPWPKMPASHPKAADRVESSSLVTGRRSPIRTASRGRPDSPENTINGVAAPPPTQTSHAVRATRIPPRNPRPLSRQRPGQSLRY